MKRDIVECQTDIFWYLLGPSLVITQGEMRHTQCLWNSKLLLKALIKFSDTNQLELISFMQKMMGMFPASIPLLSLLPSRWFCFRFSSETCVDAWLDKWKVSFHSRPRLTWYFENVKLNTLMLGDISKEIQTYSGNIFENFPTKKWAYTRQTSSLYSGNGEISTLKRWFLFIPVVQSFWKSGVFKVASNLNSIWNHYHLQGIHYFTTKSSSMLMMIL